MVGQAGRQVRDQLLVRGAARRTALRRFQSLITSPPEHRSIAAPFAPYRIPSPLKSPVPACYGQSRAAWARDLSDRREAKLQLEDLRKMC
ncbi:hypothetical protein J6590_033718 [Homalodisca vitripennis]|nr:hypothetical protein J6590_033718 [Homalodisca vitripennis]